MAHFFGWAQDNAGNRLSGATVTVYEENSSTLATIYTAATMATAAQVSGSALTAAADGFFEFYAPAEVYKYTLAKVGYDTVTVEDILLPSRPGRHDIREYGGTIDGTTDDVTAAQRAIAAALAAGGEVFWPEGTTLIGSNLTDFHSVRHRGPGAISLGGSTFYPEPKSGDTNTIYVATTGSDSNCGLDDSVPLLTLQAALDALANYGPTLAGTWIIELAAGTYTAGASAPFIRNTNRIQLKGPSVSGATPTAIVDGAGTGTGLSFRPFAYMQIKDILVKDFATGLLFNPNSDIWANNVWVDNCTTTGLHQEGGGQLRVQQGSYTNCGTGIVCYANVLYTIGYQATSTADSTTIDGCGTGFYARHASVGHIDFCIISDCTTAGVRLDYASRANVQQSDFRRNAIGLEAFLNAGWYNNSNVWNFGGVDANTIAWKNLSGAVDFGMMPSPASQEMRVVVDTTAASHTGTLTTTTIKSIWTIPQGWFVDNSKKIRIRVAGAFAGAGDKTLRILLGTGTAAGTVSGSVGSTAEWIWETEIFPTGDATQETQTTLIESGGPQVVKTNLPTTLNVVNAARAVALQGTLTDVAGTITIERVEVFILG